MQDVVDLKERAFCKLKNDVFEVVQSANQQVISSKLIITQKYENGQKITKTRLAARDFEEDLSQDLSQNLRISVLNRFPYFKLTNHQIPDDELFLWEGSSIKGIQPYFQLGPLSDILTIGNLQHAAGRIFLVHVLFK